LAARRGDAAGVSAGRHRNTLARRIDRSNRVAVRRLMCAELRTWSVAGPQAKHRHNDLDHVSRPTQPGALAWRGPLRMAAPAVPAVATWPCAVGPTRAGLGGPPAPSVGLDRTCPASSASPHTLLRFGSSVNKYLKDLES
jgi:hypothetical protein